jgi:hypothetical protein
MLFCNHGNIKLVTIALLPTLFISCQAPHKIPTSQVSQSNTQDTSWANDQRELHYWLMTQTQEVRDSFRREFTFSGQEIENLIDSLKKK